MEERYTSSADGVGTFGSVVDIGTDVLMGKPFIIRAQDGSRIGCGLLEAVDTGSLYSTVLASPDGSAVSASIVLMYNSGDGMAYYTGEASGLADVIAADADSELATIRLAESCDADSATLDVLQMPLTNVTSDGTSYFAHAFKLDKDHGVDGHGVALYDPSGARVACGELSAVVVDAGDDTMTSTADPAAVAPGAVTLLGGGAIVSALAAAAFGGAFVFW